MTGAKFYIKKFNGTGDFGLWKIKMCALLIQHGCKAALEALLADMEAQTKAELNKKAHSAVILCLVMANKLYLKKKLYTFYMPVRQKIFEHIDKFNKIVLDLTNIKVKFKDEDLALLFLTSLPASYECFVDTLIYGREALTLEDVMATLNSKEIKERSKAKGDDGEGLYVRGRTDRKDSRQSKGKSRSKSRGGRLKCYICQYEGHLKRNYLKNNRKKSTGYVKKDEKPSSSGSTYDDSKVMMVMSVQALLDWIIDSGCSYHMKPRECKIRGIDKSGKVKVINGSRVVLSGIRRENCVYSLDGHAMVGELNASVEEKDSLAQVWHKRLGHISEAGLQVPYQVNSLGVTSRNVVFNESVMYKDTLKDSGACVDKSVEELQVEVELQRLNNHTLEEPRTRTKPLRFRDESNMAAYAFIAAEEEDNHEPLTYQEIKEGIEGVQKPRYKARLVAHGITQRVGAWGKQMKIICMENWSETRIVERFRRGVQQSGCLMYWTGVFWQARYRRRLGFVDSDYAKDLDKEAEVYGPYRGCEGNYLAKGTLGRVRHINVRITISQQVLERSTVKILKVGTEYNAADALMKVVPGLKLQHCLELLNVGVG
ncbi:hypothetical protein Tco_0761734 [Tanacetum coccineum]